MFVSEGTRGAPPAHNIAVLRLTIGAVQGGALYFLYYASEITRLKNAGCQIQADDGAGTRRIFTFDPFGNRIELIQEAHL